MPKVICRKSTEASHSRSVESDLSKSSSNKKFQFQWYDDFSGWRYWVRPVKNDSTLFYCRACKKSFACGKSNIERHENTKGHEKACILLKFDDERHSSQVASHNISD